LTQGIPNLILVSQSPRRRELLERAGFTFTVAPSWIEECREPGEAAEVYACRLARDKAAAASLHPGQIALAADTIVVVDEHVLEKPADAVDARRMLRMLSGREHDVITGVALRQDGHTLVELERTRVFFCAMSEEEIEAYVATGEPMDKAGAYAIQGLASKYIFRIEGCYFNVVGLPVARVYRMLASLSESAAGAEPGNER
jgi:septum formation protein